MSKANPYRAELPDGTRIERSYRVEKGADGRPGKKVPRGNWQWVVYDPDRRPTRKRVNLRTKDKGAAMRKALELARDLSLGTFDPWTDAARRRGRPLHEGRRPLPRRQAAHGFPVHRRDRPGPPRPARARTPRRRAGSHVERAQVEAFVNARKRPPKDEDGVRRGPGPEASPETKKRRRASVQHFFSWAIGRGLCPTNPAEDVRLPKAPAARRDHVTEAEAAAILRAAAAAEVGRGAPSVESRVGPRLGRVRARDRTPAGRAGGSGGAPSGSPSARSRSARDTASRRPGAGGRSQSGAPRSRSSGGSTRTDTEADGPVFLGAYGGPVALDYLTKRLQTLAERAGVEKHVTAYALRHAYGTRMAAAGVPLLDLAKLMGTSVRMIEKHYGHYDPARGASHVERVFGSSCQSSRCPDSPPTLMVDGGTS